MIAVADPDPSPTLPPFEVNASFSRARERTDWGLKMLDVPEAWTQTKGEGIRVAVIDTGIDREHPDLTLGVVESRDFSGSPSGAGDINGHGTHCAGIIGARANGLGVVGVAPACQIINLKALGDRGGGSDAAIASAILAAIDVNADIVSMSLGAASPMPKIEHAIQAIVGAGIFVITAAGNDGSGKNTMNFPAGYHETVAVGAIKRDGSLSEFSSRGIGLHVVAPGERIYSTYPGGGYAELSGTSMACPFVAGVAALAVAKHRNQGGASPIDSQADLIEHLAKTATDIGPEGWDLNTGWGIINPKGMIDV